MSDYTVAELLADADRDARHLLGHTGPDDGPGLTAAWPGLLRSAAVLLSSAPQPRIPHTADDLPALDGHVHRMLAEATTAPPLRLPAPHDSCAWIIATWYQAAAQAARAAHSPHRADDAATDPTNPATPTDPADPADPVDPVDPVALRTRVARTLATVAHVAGQELQAHTQRRQDVDNREPRPHWVLSKSNPPPNHAERQWARMLHRHEHHALDHLVAPSTEAMTEPHNQRSRGARTHPAGGDHDLVHPRPPPGHRPRERRTRSAPCCPHPAGCAARGCFPGPYGRAPRRHPRRGWPSPSGPDHCRREQLG